MFVLVGVSRVAVSSLFAAVVNADDVDTNNYYYGASAATCFGWDGDNLSWTSPGIGRNMAHLFWLGFVCVSLLLSCEYLKYYADKINCMVAKLYSHMCKRPVKEDKYDLNCYESDVVHEKQTVNNADPHNYCLYLK